MTMKLALNTQRDLLQQSNVEVPSDAYLTLTTTVAQNFPAGIYTIFNWNTIVDQHRCTFISPTSIEVPDTGWYIVSVAIAWNVNQTVFFRTQGNPFDAQDIGRTEVSNAAANQLFYIVAGFPFYIQALPLGVVQSVITGNYPRVKIKKVR
jgi:hypothetical protein